MNAKIEANLAISEGEIGTEDDFVAVEVFADAFESVTAVAIGVGELEFGFYARDVLASRQPEMAT